MSEVSAIIPCRDGEAYLAEAIGSILDEAERPAELIVVDDGSRDGAATAAIVDGCGAPVRGIRRERAGGIAAACNLGVATARGELIAFLDADDLWTAGKLARQLAILRAEPALEAVFGHALEFASPELSAAERAAVVVRAEPLPGRVRGTMLARRSLLERVGPFDESLRVGDFVDWQARAEEAGARTLLIDDVLLRRRIHTANMGRSDPEQRLGYVRAVRAALHRRQGARP